MMRLLIVNIVLLLLCVNIINASKCTREGGKCLDINNNACNNGKFVRGKCPGAANIRCCLKSQTGRGLTSNSGSRNTNGGGKNKCERKLKGKCGSINEYKCEGGKFKSGYCPGAADVKCCTTGNLKKRSSNTFNGVNSIKGKWNLIKKCYPQGTSVEAKKNIGGRVNADWITNTCAVRMSHTINCAKLARIPSIQNEYIDPSVPRGPKVQTVTGANGLNYIFRVKVLKRYFNKWFSKPDIHIKKKSNCSSPFVLSKVQKYIDQLKDVKGIVFFDIPCWGDADGHYDGWTGKYMLEHNHKGDDVNAKYFQMAENIYVWKAN